MNDQFPKYLIPIHDVEWGRRIHRQSIMLSFKELTSHYFSNSEKFILQKGLILSPFFLN